jgi:hypothetical protein
MNIKGWMMGVSWGVLCSPSWGSMDESVGSRPKERLMLDERLDEKPEPEVEETFNATVDIADGDQSSDYSSENEESSSDEDSDGNRVDLSSLYPLLADNMGNFLIEEGPYEECRRNLIELLQRELYGPPSGTEEGSTEDDMHNGADSEKYEQCKKALLSVARRYKETYTPKELKLMNIDVERLYEIRFLCSLPKLRPFTKQEDSLMDKAMGTMDRNSAGQRILRAIGKASKNPQKALEEVKLIIEETDLDVNLVYKSWSPNTSGSLFLNKAAEISRDKGLELARFFMDKGIDPDTLPDYGTDDDRCIRETPLHCAARKGNIKVAQLLLDRGAGVNLKNSKGWTPLHSAVYFDSFRVARLLIAHGANRDIQNNEGKTAFEIAIEYQDRARRTFDAKIKKLRSYTP